MVNINLGVDLKPFDTKITTQVSSDDVLSRKFPLSRIIESLIEVAIEPKGLVTDGTPQLEIVVSFLEC